MAGWLAVREEPVHAQNSYACRAYKICLSAPKQLVRPEFSFNQNLVQIRDLCWGCGQNQFYGRII